MALERLQARTAAGIPDPNGAVVGRRRQPRQVVREGHRHDRIAMALKRLQTRAPPVAHSWPNTDWFWLFVLEQLSDQTTCRTEQECEGAWSGWTAQLDRRVDHRHCRPASCPH
jgi:hypothetical protein